MALCPLRDNYFWRVYVTGRYSRESCPEYLKRPNFLRLKAGLVDRVQSFDGTVTQCLAAATRPFDAFVLLDHMDWLARHQGALQDEWSRIFARGFAEGPHHLQERRTGRGVPPSGSAKAPHLRHRSRDPAPRPGSCRDLWILPHRAPRYRLTRSDSPA